MEHYYTENLTCKTELFHAQKSLQYNREQTTSGFYSCAPFQKGGPVVGSMLCHEIDEIVNGLKLSSSTFLLYMRSMKTVLLEV